MKAIGTLKIIISVILFFLAYSTNFGLFHELKWLPDLFESIGWVGIFLSLYIFFDGIGDITLAGRIAAQSEPGTAPDSK